MGHGAVCGSKVDTQTTPGLQASKAGWAAMSTKFTHNKYTR